MSNVAGTGVRGHVERGWGKVADTFRANFERSPGAAGAACSVYVGGRPVVGEPRASSLAAAVRSCLK